MLPSLLVPPYSEDTATSSSRPIPVADEQPLRCICRATKSQLLEQAREADMRAHVGRSIEAPLDTNAVTKFWKVDGVGNQQ